MKIASIDIGSNTVLMLIAVIDKKKAVSSINNYYRMPRLAKGLDKSGEISEEKLEEFFEVLNEYKQIILKEKCDKILVNATAAMRNAKNSDSIIKVVKEKFEININVIDGNTEAEYSFLGATSSYLDLPNDKIVIDIGGASTEIVVGDNNGIKYSKSFNIGAVKLTDKVVQNDPPIKSEISELHKEVQGTFNEINNKFDKNLFTIAVAGTPTTLSCIKQNLKDYVEEKVEDSVLSKHDLEFIISEMSNKSGRQILEDYGEVVKGRNDVILAGSIILYNLFDILNIDEIHVSSKGIRYGAIIAYLNDVNQ
ncbi:MAG: hypothetical protein JEY94_10995 [Melioribacteraceae bacterium]|nr:hypothetical protein [Melioribacteraceae bacterium]